MPTDSKNKTLWQKLIEVRQSCPALSKDSMNQWYKFKYVSSTQTLGALRSKMDELGVLLVPQVKEYTVTDHTTKKGDHEYFTEIKLSYVWINADNPDETITCDWYAQGLDDAEKGVGKALTYGEKYFLLKFFNIPTDNADPDAGRGKNRNKYDTPSIPAPTKPPATPPQQAKSSAEPTGGYKNCTEKQAAAIYNFLHKPSPDILPNILNHLLGREIASTYQLTPDEASKLFDMNKNDKAGLDQVVRWFKENPETETSSNIDDPPEGFFDQPDMPDDDMPF